MNPSDLNRMDVVIELCEYLDIVSFEPEYNPNTQREHIGPAAIWTTYWILRMLILDKKPQLSNRMYLVKQLKKYRPALWDKLRSYIAPDSRALIED
jgi:hypothetical protein